MKGIKKELTKEQVLLKLTAMCSSSEHCSGDMLKKMEAWEVNPKLQSEVMEYLIKEKYIDDRRFAGFFVNDKIKYNKWGRRKVEQALWEKRVDSSIAHEVLDEVPDELYVEILSSLLHDKRKSVKGKNSYDVKCKLVRFALGRGFTYDIINKCIDETEEMSDYDM